MKWPPPCIEPAAVFTPSQRKVAKIEAPTTVMIPLTTIASPAMAPSISPICIAFEVPIAWAEVPSASPLAIGL